MEKDKTYETHAKEGTENYLDMYAGPIGYLCSKELAEGRIDTPEDKQQRSMDKQHQFDLRYLRMAEIWSENSYAKRRQVGCLVVKDRMIISDGYNGTPTGFPNVCEDDNNVTFPYVLHAEANAITKLAKSGNSAEGATLYCTDMPCLECAKLIIQSGIRRVVYRRDYHTRTGLELLKKARILVEQM